MKHIIYKSLDNYQEDILNEFFYSIKNIKQERITKLKNKQDKYLSILGEYLLMNILKENYNTNYQDINIIYNENGKPYIENSNIYFNISHSNNYAAVIVSNKECGIDIEKIRDINTDIIKIYASPNEQKYILENNTITRLYEIYCLKEAYLKMYGLKLNNIQNVEFIITNKKIVCSDLKVDCKLIHHQDYIIATCEKK